MTAREILVTIPWLYCKAIEIFIFALIKDIDMDIDRFHNMRWITSNQVIFDI